LDASAKERRVIFGKEESSHLPYFRPRAGNKKLSYSKREGSGTRTGLSTRRPRKRKKGGVISKRPFMEEKGKIHRSMDQKSDRFSEGKKKGRKEGNFNHLYGKKKKTGLPIRGDLGDIVFAVGDSSGEGKKKKGKII